MACVRECTHVHMPAYWGPLAWHGTMFHCHLFIYYYIIYIIAGIGGICVSFFWTVLFYFMPCMARVMNLAMEAERLPAFLVGLFKYRRLLRPG